MLLELEPWNERSRSIKRHCLVDSRVGILIDLYSFPKPPPIKEL